MARDGVTEIPRTAQTAHPPSRSIRSRETDPLAAAAHEDGRAFLRERVLDGVGLQFGRAGLPLGGLIEVGRLDHAREANLPAADALEVGQILGGPEPARGWHRTAP